MECLGLSNWRVGNPWLDLTFVRESSLHASLASKADREGGREREREGAKSCTRSMWAERRSKGERKCGGIKEGWDGANVGERNDHERGKKELFSRTRSTMKLCSLSVFLACDLSLSDFIRGHGKSDV